MARSCVFFQGQRDLHRLPSEPGALRRAHGGGKVHRQPPLGQRSQVGPEALRRRHLLRPTHHLSLRGGSGQVWTLNLILRFAFGEKAFIRINLIRSTSEIQGHSH